jgi:hypothetical protein
MKTALGVTATDIITGFKGIVTGRCEYLSGCNQVLITPKIASDGSPREASWFDEQRIKIDPRANVIALENAGVPGFDKSAPKR